MRLVRVVTSMLVAAACAAEPAEPLPPPAMSGHGDWLVIFPFDSAEFDVNAHRSLSQLAPKRYGTRARLAAVRTPTLSGRRKPTWRSPCGGETQSSFFSWLAACARIRSISRQTAIGFLAASRTVTSITTGLPGCTWATATWVTNNDCVTGMGAIARRSRRQVPSRIALKPRSKSTDSNRQIVNRHLRATIKG
jgi:hypothetical protein